MWSTWKTHKYLAFKSGSSQTGIFKKGPEGWELSSQNGKPPFKTGELEHMLSPLAKNYSEIVKRSCGGTGAITAFLS